MWVSLLMAAMPCMLMVAPLLQATSWLQLLTTWWLLFAADDGMLAAAAAALAAGRILIAQGAIDACKIGTTIALRYSAARPQFGDKLISDYLTHQRRLLPGLAATYAMHLTMKHLKVI
jgi:alkylation response protein AidB-like acyl-CoA dehydrogenase